MVYMYSIRRSVELLFACVALLVLSISVFPSVVFGQELPQGTLIVRPAKLELTIAPGKEKQA